MLNRNIEMDLGELGVNQIIIDNSHKIGLLLINSGRQVSCEMSRAAS
jgi:hypothetical protein